MIKQLCNDSLKRRLLLACDTLFILASYDDLDCDASIGKLLMMCVDRGVSASWILHHKGLFWHRHNIICEN